jgi:hypothetical protein
MTVPLMMGFLVLGSNADELTVRVSDDSLQQQAAAACVNFKMVKIHRGGSEQH